MIVQHVTDTPEYSKSLKKDLRWASWMTRFGLWKRGVPFEVWSKQSKEWDEGARELERRGNINAD